MKLAAALGVIGFLLGAATAPHAANDSEVRRMLCARFWAAGGTARLRMLETLRTRGGQALPPAFEAEARTLATIDATFCR
jgi:hypothetical protein